MEKIFEFGLILFIWSLEGFHATEEAVNGCSNIWEKGGDACYFESKNYVKNVVNARSLCANAGMRLASIESQEELEHLKDYLGSKKHLALIDGDVYKVGDKQLSAGSGPVWPGAGSPPCSRLLNQPAECQSIPAWNAPLINPDGDSWIQVDLLYIFEIRKITTQGLTTADSWVQSFYIGHRKTIGTWSKILLFIEAETGSIEAKKEFEGNTDKDGLVSHRFTRPFQARLVRLYPVSCTGMCGLRWELYGDLIGGRNTMKPLISGPTPVGDSAITANNNFDSALRAQCSRMVEVPWVDGCADFPAWAIGIGDNIPWIMVTFEATKQVNAVGTTGRFLPAAPYRGQFVKKYTISYMTASGSYTYHLEEGSSSNTKIFDGNTNYWKEVRNVFEPPIQTTAVRLHPKTTSCNDYCSLKWELYSDLPDHQPGNYDLLKPLISGPEPVPDEAITASSSDANHPPVCLRRDYGTVALTCNAPPSDQFWVQNLDVPYNVIFVQIVFDRTRLVHVIETVGRSSGDQGWVKKYALTYNTNPDSEVFTAYSTFDEESIKIFDGNTDSISAVRNELIPPIEACKIRLYTVSRNHDWCVNMCTMQLELYSYIYYDFPLINGNAQTSPAATLDSQFEASSYWRTAAHGPWCSRLLLTPIENRFCNYAWSAEENTQSQWIQIDLRGIHIIHAVLTMGRSNFKYQDLNLKQRVTSYKLSYYSGDIRETYLNGKIFNGNFDNETSVIHHLEPPIVSQIVRLHPITWNQHISLMWELYGYKYENTMRWTSGMPSQWTWKGSGRPMPDQGAIADWKAESTVAHSEAIDCTYISESGIGWLNCKNDEKHRLGVLCEISANQSKINTSNTDHDIPQRSGASDENTWLPSVFILYNTPVNIWGRLGSGAPVLLRSMLFKDDLVTLYGLTGPAYIQARCSITGSVLPIVESVDNYVSISYPYQMVTVGYADSSWFWIKQNGKCLSGNGQNLFVQPCSSGPYLDSQLWRIDARRALMHKDNNYKFIAVDYVDGLPNAYRQSKKRQNVDTWFLRRQDIQGYQGKVQFMDIDSQHCLTREIVGAMSGQEPVVLQPCRDPPTSDQLWTRQAIHDSPLSKLVHKSSGTCLHNVPGVKILTSGVCDQMSQNIHEVWKLTVDNHVMSPADDKVDHCLDNRGHSAPMTSPCVNALNSQWAFKAIGGSEYQVLSPVPAQPGSNVCLQQGSTLSDSGGCAAAESDTKYLIEPWRHITAQPCKSSDWTLIGNKCYRLQPIVQGGAFHNAEEHCQIQGAEMASFTDRSQYSQLVTDGLGLFVWLGRMVGNQPVWNSGSSSTFTDWHIAQPTCLHSTGCCFAVEKLSGRWMTPNCTLLPPGIADPHTICSMDPLKTEHSYMGCYDVSTAGGVGHSFQVEKITNLTSLFCINEICKDYKFAGVSAENSACKCWRENLPRRSMVSQGNCNQPCDGDDRLFCGGSSGYFAIWKRNICNSLPEPVNGVYANCSRSQPFQPGTACSIACEPGYKIDGLDDFEIQCLDNGTWTFLPDCQIKACDVDNVSPPLTLIGRNVSDAPIVGENIKYGCEIGYIPESGDFVRHCLIEGVLNGTIPTCTVTTCDPPILNSGVELTSQQQDNYEYGDIINVKCGQYLVRVSGDLQQNCSLDGVWLGENLTCTAITCTEPSLGEGLEQITPIQSEYNMGDVVTFQCIESYRYDSGELQRMCSNDGTWSEQQPACIAVSCETPPNIWMTEVSYTDVQVGSVATYSCIEGFRYLSGLDTRVCQSDGSWSGSILLCKEKTCGPPPDVEETVRHTVGSGLNATTFYQCLDGYKIQSGDTVKYCMNESWVGEDLQCIEKECNEDLESFLNASKPEVYSRRVGSKVTYLCDPGFELSGGGNIAVCQEDETWLKASPVCTVLSCGVPIGVEGALVTYDKDTVGSIALYTCKYGYTGNDGDGLSTCGVGGEWSEPDIICTEIPCPTLGMNPTLTSNVTSYMPGGTASHICNHGYKYTSGTLVWTCEIGGFWTGDDVRCEEVECPDLVIDDAIEVVEKSNSALTTGAHIWTTCKFGYHSGGGDEKIYCTKDGIWSGNPVECHKITCPDFQGQDAAHLNSVSSGSNIGDNITFSCNEGYILEGRNVITCSQNGSWYPSERPTCKGVKCSSPPDVNHAVKKITSFSYQSRVEYICAEGYVYGPGSSTGLLCNSTGQWSGELPTCTEIECEVPESPKNGVMLFANLTVNSTAVMSCHDGFALKGGNNSFICTTQGKWEGVKGTCEKLTCGDPPRIENTTWTHDPYLRGQRVNYKCFPGYGIFGGQLQKSCSGDLTWDGDDPICNAIHVEEIDFLAENLTAEEKALKAKGMTKSDMEKANIATGALGPVLISVTVFSLIALDAISITYHCSILKKNISHVLRR